MNNVKMETINKKVNRRSEYNNLDHLYCHTNRNDSGNYVRPKNSSTDMDMVSVLKEIKQLKSTINLHLDLIQDQSDQLISKDKLLMILKKENDLLKAKIEKLERRNKSNSKKDESPIVEQLIADLPEINAKQDMLNKMSSTLLNKCTMKLNALEDVLGFDIQQPTADSKIDNSSSNIIPNAGGNDVADITTTTNNNNKNSTKNSSSIIGTLDGKPISKIVLQRVIVNDAEDLAIKSEKKDSPVKIKDEKLSPTQPQLHQNLSNCVDKSINSLRVSKETSKASDDGVASAKSNPSNVKSESSRKNHLKNGKKEHKNSKVKSDDNASSITRHRREEKSKTQTKIAVQKEEPPPVPTQMQKLLPPPVTSSLSPSPSTSQCHRNTVMTTTNELYHTREWQMDEIEVLVNKQISDCGEDGVNVDEINLEIPRWCIREINNGAYSSEGTEDLSDDVFIKRHARLEHAEKKRKKWDVQRIREIRNIERLKRRHCKNEVDNNEQTAEGMTSFYPSPENVKYVQVADELPVVAFGEPIHLPPASEFTLPWDHQYRDTALSISPIATISNVDHTTIVFRAKKRPARRVTSTQPPKAPSKSRSSKRSRR